MAYLVAIANTRDDLATRRILNVPKRGIGDASETQIANYAEKHKLSVREVLSHVSELGFGPKITNAISQLAELMDNLEAMIPNEQVDVILRAVLDRTGLLESLRNSKDPQDEARVEWPHKKGRLHRGAALGRGAGPYGQKKAASGVTGCREGAGVELRRFRRTCIRR
jgi:superfamily I DNA/RNA helicase